MHVQLGEPARSGAPGTDETTVGAARAGSGTDFDLLFERVYPAVVGIARRVLDRDRSAAPGSDRAADDIAVEVMTRARVHHFGDTDRAAEHIVGWTADACLTRIIGHPGRVALPAGARADDLLTADLLEDGVGAEWDVHGLALWELQEALSGARRSDRRVGVLCLGCGLTPLHTAVVLGVTTDAVDASLARVGVRLSDRRRVSAEVESPLDARLGDQ